VTGGRVNAYAALLSLQNRGAQPKKQLASYRKADRTQASVKESPSAQPGNFMDNLFEAAGF
jgi:hypothetical protein